MQVVASWSRAAVAALALAVAAPVPRALGVVFDERVDRFEADGNAYGPVGGPLDLVDDFNDGNLAPSWQPGIGTAVETGGFLHVTNPGQVVQIGSVNYEISNVQSTTTLQDGLGDFSVTSWWAQQLPAAGHEIDMTLLDQGASRAYTVDVQNYSGLRFTELVLDLTGTPQVTYFDNWVIDPALLTGEIGLRIAFDDGTDTVHASISLDGGVSFVTPLAPVSLTGLDAVVELGSSPEHSHPTTTTTSITVTTSTSTSSTTSTTPLQFTDCTGPAASMATASLYLGSAVINGDESVFFRTVAPISLAGADPTVDGVEVLVEEVETFDGDPFVSDPLGLYGASAVPPGLPGSGCHPRDGWRVTQQGFTYRNVSGSFPPSCAPGSALGLSVLRLTRHRGDTLLVRGRAKGQWVNFYRPGTVIHAVVLGRGGAPLAGGRCATATLHCVLYPSVARCAVP